MGAEVVLTRSDVGRGHPDYYQDLAEAITARPPGALFVNQFANPANPVAHEQTTGPEILPQIAQWLERHLKIARVHYPGLRRIRSTPWPSGRCTRSVP